MSNEEFLSTNAHISNEQVLKDIRDTEKEIRELNEQIEERECFVNKLNLLLQLRKEKQGYKISDIIHNE